MKYSFINPLIFLYQTIAAQVPSQSGDTGDLRGDIEVGVPEVPASAKKTAGYYQKDGKYGFVDPQGVKQTPVYNKIIFASHGFIIQKGELYGIADKNGQVIGNIEYDSVGTANETAYIVKKKDKYGTISNDGKKVLSARYDKILSTNSFVSFVRSANGQIQMIFNEQEKAFAYPIEHALLYANMVIIKANGKFGAVKKQLVVPLNYDSVFVSAAQVNTVIKPPKQPAKKYSPIDRSNSFRDLIVSGQSRY